MRNNLDYKQTDRTAINKARIVYYGLFSSLFAFSMDEENFEIINKAVDVLIENPIDESTAESLKKIRQFLHENGYDFLKKESDTIFFNPVNSCIPMTASYYFDNRDDGTKRVEMIDFILESKFRKNGDEFKENEDHIEFILLFIQKLIDEELAGDESSASLSKRIFQNILNDMINEFAQNLFSHKMSNIYKEVAIVLRSFSDFERLYLDIPPPVKIEQKNFARLKLQKEKQPRKCV